MAYIAIERIPPQQNHHMAAAAWPPSLSGYTSPVNHRFVQPALLRAQTTGVSHDSPVSGLSVCLSVAQRAVFGLSLSAAAVTVSCLDLSVCQGNWPASF